MCGGGILLVVSALGYYFNSSITLYYVPYIFGSFMALNFRENVLTKYSHKKRLYSFFCLLITFIMQTTVGLTQGPAVMPLRIFQIILVWICADILAIDQQPQWWIKISFFIYVSHIMILESTEKLFYLTIGDNTIGAIVDHIFAPVITISVIIGIAYLLRTYMPLCWKILNGGRS